MSDLERDLTTVLAERAGHPYGDLHAALAEHDRRLAARAKTVRNRSVAGVMAVVAVVGVSSALLLNRPAEPSQPVATQPTVESAPTATADGTDPSVADAVETADFTADGRRWTAYVVIARYSDSPCAHVIAVPADEPPTSTERYGDSQGCQDLEVHPGDPLISQLSVLPVSDNEPGPLPDVTVWITVPEVAEISVVRSGGDTITAALLDTIENMKVFVTSKSIAHAQGFTMRDANGTVLREDVG